VSGIVLARPRSRATAFSLDADAVAIGLVAAVTLVLTIVTWRAWGDLGQDTGYDFVAATRVAHGHLPYSDFVYYYGPLAPFALGFAALIGGSGFMTFAAVGLVLTYAIVAATYALARTQTGPTGAAIVAAATSAIAFSPTNVSFVVPHTYSESFAILLTLGFLLGLARASAGSRGAALAGICAGLVALTRPEFEAAVLAAAAVWLVVRARGGRPVRGLLVRIALPAALVPAVVYGAYLTALSPHRLFFENLYPVDTLRAGGSAILRSQAPLTARSIGQVLAYLALYAVGAVALVLGARGLERLSSRTRAFAIAAVAAAVLAVAAVDPEAARSKLQWVIGGFPAASAIAACAIVIFVLRRRHALAPREEAFAAVVVVAAVLAAKTYDGFFFLADHAQPAVYVAPFVLVALARLHLVDLARTRSAYAAGAAWLAVIAVVCVGLTIKDGRAQSANIAGPGGSMRVTPAEATVYRAAIGAIDSSTRPGEPILIAPQLTALYTLTGRTDPLPQISLVPGALPTAADERAAIDALEHANVRLALTDRHSFSDYGQTRFGASFDRVLASWIRRHFNHAALLRPGGGVDHTLDVWVRRGS